MKLVASWRLRKLRDITHTAGILEFFGHIDVVYIDNDSDSEVEVAESVTNDDSIKYKAVSTPGEYRSAITVLYKEQRMAHLLKANKKAESNMSLHDEKRPVTLEAFRSLVAFSFQSGYEALQYLANTYSLYYVSYYQLFGGCITKSLDWGCTCYITTKA